MNLVFLTYHASSYFVRIYVSLVNFLHQLFVVAFTACIVMCMHSPSSRPQLSKVKISTDALRMRCRRLCEKKPSGKTQVDSSICEDYRKGGQSREILEMALLECLAKRGLDRSSYKKIKVKDCEII